MNKGNSNNESKEEQKSPPNIWGTEPSNINARLNRIYGNLQTAASPSQVKVLRRPWRTYTPEVTELEIDEQRRLRERPSVSNNFLEDSKNDQKKKEEKIQKKVRFEGVPCSGDNAEAGQNPASSSTKNRELSWEELRDLPLPDDKDEGL